LLTLDGFKNKIVKVHNLQQKEEEGPSTLSLYIPVFYNAEHLAIMRA
jgi:hypothetical protein